MWLRAPPRGRGRRALRARGGILDIYATGLADPLRLEFDGDTLASLRRFDASTQRSIEQLPAATVLPRYEVVIEPHEADAVAERLRAAGGTSRRTTRRPGTAPGRQSGARARGGWLFHDGMERFAAHYDPDLARCSTTCPSGRWCARRPGRAARPRRGVGRVVLRRGFDEAARALSLDLAPDALLRARHSLAHSLVAGVDWLGRWSRRATRSATRTRLIVECRPRAHAALDRAPPGHLAELGANGIEPVILCDNPGQRDRLRELLGTPGRSAWPGLGRLHPAGRGLAS